MAAVAEDPDRFAGRVAPDPAGFTAWRATVVFACESTELRADEGAALGFAAALTAGGLRTAVFVTGGFAIGGSTTARFAPEGFGRPGAAATGNFEEAAGGCATAKGAGDLEGSVTARSVNSRIESSRISVGAGCPVVDMACSARGTRSRPSSSIAIPNPSAMPTTSASMSGQTFDDDR
jgi:hypothetical protein